MPRRTNLPRFQTSIDYDALVEATDPEPFVDDEPAEPTRTPRRYEILRLSLGLNRALGRRSYLQEAVASLVAGLGRDAGQMAVSPIVRKAVADGLANAPPREETVAYWQARLAELS